MASTMSIFGYISIAMIILVTIGAIYCGYLVVKRASMINAIHDKRIESGEINPNSLFRSEEERQKFIKDAMEFIEKQDSPLAFLPNRQGEGREKK